MPTTLRRLLANRQFSMHLVNAAAIDDSALDEPISWAHSSDLRDPTPWLEPGQLLLTDGAQFSTSAPGPTGEGDDFAYLYVKRLQDRGVRALGFATGIVVASIPPELVAACSVLRFPLLEVDEKTPFIGIIRLVADEIANDRRARLEWSMEAQRAVARAALRPDGLPAILIELSRRLNCWVSLYDSAQNPLTVPQLDEMPPAIRPLVDNAVHSVLRRGARAGLRTAEPDASFTLQTLGQSGKLLGVLVVGAATPLDHAENDLVSSVIGLASIALEQRRTLDTARRRLRTGLFELLLSGVVDVADRTATTLWGPLPAEPIRVAVVAGPVPGQSLFDELEFTADRREGGFFFAERAEELILVTEGDHEMDALQSLLARHGLGAGFSGGIGWRDLSRGLTEARRARRAVSRDDPFVTFEHLAEHGMQGLLLASGGAELARRMLSPLLELPAEERDALITTLRVWLTHNGVWDPAARELGIHRHTLRSRVRRVDLLLDLDLEGFGDRAELWAALQLLD